MNPHKVLKENGISVACLKTINRRLWNKILAPHLGFRTLKTRQLIRRGKTIEMQVSW